MRLLKTFILRVLVDNSVPHALRGSLQDVNTRESHPFIGEAPLISLLQDLLKKKDKPEAENPGNKQKEDL
jgi:hypothetical protein